MKGIALGLGQDRAFKQGPCQSRPRMSLSGEDGFGTNLPDEEERPKNGPVR